MNASYKVRRRLGLITRSPRPRIPSNVRREVARRYFAREKTQVELALEYGISQPTVARIVENWEFYTG